MSTVKDISESQYDSSGWSASLYNKAANFVYSTKFTSPVLRLLAPVPGESIIDFGCGSGEVTLELEKLVKSKDGTGLVVGLDVSENMVHKAKANGVEHAHVVDIENISNATEYFGKDHQFDAVFSNATLHWCKNNPRGVLQGVKRVLKPSGRFVAEMGGFMNCIGVRSAIHRVLRSRGHDPETVDPWYFPSVEEYRELLKTEGFKPVTMELIPRVTPLPEGVYGWLATFARTSFLKGFSDQEADDILREVEEVCRVDCQDKKTGEWSMMYMRLRFSAVLDA